MKTNRMHITAWLFALWLPTLCACTGETPPPTWTCVVAADAPEREAVETRCDGIDNDCDGLTDVLPGGAANVCTGQGQGACAETTAVCVDGERVCLNPVPMAEVSDGADNDCDGVTDEADEADAGDPLPVSIRLLVPPYLHSEDQGSALDAVRMVAHALAQTGLPASKLATAANADADFYSAIDEAAQGQHAVLLVPGYLTSSLLHVADGDLGPFGKLKAFVAAGGVLVWTKPIGISPDHDVDGQAEASAMLAFAGLKGTFKARMDALRVRISRGVPATSMLDGSEEVEQLLTTTPDSHPVETLIYVPLASEEVEVFARAHGENGDLGAVGIRRTYGKGAIYTFGWDPTEFTQFRCYVNCYDPGMDVFGQMMRGILHEATRGHTVRLHGLPGSGTGVLILTHDVDAPDADNSGIWGDPGAFQMADMEKAEGVKGTYFVTTDYVNDYYGAHVPVGLCARGMCPAGAHGVQHIDWSESPFGGCGPTAHTCCAWRQSNYVYTHPSVCGEVEVSAAILRKDVGPSVRLDGWRTPYLGTNPGQYDALAGIGVRYDSSLSVGDVRTGAPVDARAFGWLQDDLFHGNDIVIFPIALEDGIGWMEEGVEHRLELSKWTFDRFMKLWRNALRNYARNDGIVTLLVHPSYGLGVGPSNLPYKIDAVRTAIRDAKALGMRVETMADIYDFWRGRLDTRVVDARWRAGIGYTGRVIVGSVDAPRLTLAFGDKVSEVQTAPSTPVQIDGHLVTFTLLKAGVSVGFVVR